MMNKLALINHQICTKEAPMTRFIYDQFTKEYLPELLQQYGTAKASEKVRAEIKEIDVLFYPTSEVPSTPDTLGLLGQIAQKACLIEVFRNPVTRLQIRSCLGKLVDVHSSEIRELNRQNQSINEDNLAYLWILSPTVSERILTDFWAKEPENWLKGVYFLAPALKTGIVAIHQLPVNRETLWLRILGRGKVQQQAIEELQNLPKNHPFRETILELISNLIAMLEQSKQEAGKLEPEDEQLIMKLSPIYQQRLEEATQKGIEQGKESERRGMIESIILTRFGQIDAQLNEIIPEISKLPVSELTPLLLLLSREELLARFSKD